MNNILRYSTGDFQKIGVGGVFFVLKFDEGRVIFFLGVSVRRGGRVMGFLASSNIYFCFASQSREISDSIKYL